MSPRASRPWWPLLLVTISVMGLAWAYRLEQGSVERANRLHRARYVAEAAGLYRNRLEAGATAARTRYNLGTALLALDVAEAPEELALAAESGDAELRTRALFNLGLWSLSRAMDAATSDSVRNHVLRAIEANKGALRSSPGRAEAMWNLALARQLLDSIDSEEGRSTTESSDGSADTDELALSDEVREFEDEGSVSDTPRRGSAETLVEEDDGMGLSDEDAREILASRYVEPSVIVRKLLTFEGREQRRQRAGRSAPRW